MSAAAVTADEWSFLDRDEAIEPERVPRGQADPHDGHLHGFVFDMPFEEYAKIDSLNGSSVLAMERSPMHYRFCKDNQRPETPALKLGKLIHTLTLEPHLASTFAVWGSKDEHFTDAGNLRPRNGKLWDAFKQAHADKEILTVHERDEVINTSTAALANAPIRKYAYAPGSTEVSAFWRDPATGLRMKARFDKMLTEEHCIVDLKSTVSSDFSRFTRQAWTMGYVTKMAHYWNGYTILTGHEPRMAILAIEKTGACEGAVYNIQRDDLLLGLERFESLVQRIDECQKNDAWPPAVEGESFLGPCPPYLLNYEPDTELGLEL